MVAVLWDSSNKRAAIQLEELWTQALRDRSFHLHCAYPRSGFINSEEAAICGMHSHQILA
jgi:hypothetical protein